ncbi:MAG TPA: oligopeptide/dipeptide ABC transporter ATP-binding protein [Candidatus Limnocylindrales bacterium]|jgi:oligopeptide transport system ATP-binding protein
MSATTEHALTAPTIKGALRRRPPHGIQRARAIMYGIIALVLVVAGLLLTAGVLFKAGGAIGALVTLWPAYVISVLCYIAPRGYRDRKLWSLGLSVLIGVVLVVGAVALLYTALNPAPIAAAPAASGAVASGAPAASAVAAASVAPGASAGAGAVVDSTAAQTQGNVAFFLGAISLIFFAFGIPLLWGLYRERAWFLASDQRHPVKTAEHIEAESGGFAEITAVSSGSSGADGDGATISPHTLAPLSDAMAAGREPLVSVRGLKKHFPILGGVLRRQVGTIYAVDGVDFDVYPGEVFSVVGESGCGKTTLGRTLLQLTPPTDGHVVFDGYELADVDPDDMRPLRRRMQIIFQDPFGSLNPRMPISDIIGEGLLAQGVTDRKERDKRTGDALEVVGLRRDYSRRYPHEFSGGQRQRIGVARSLALSPDFIVCDEPVSALDVSIQSQVLNLLLDLKRDFNLTYLFISHNLSVVEYFSDRIAVMYLGKVAEIGTVDELYRNPRHPYTVALLSAIPIADPRRRRKRLVLKGDVPSPAAPPSGCRFHTRCWLRERLGNPERCATEDPALRPLGAEGHRTACHFAEQISETAVAEAVETQSVVETAAASE